MGAGRATPLRGRHYEALLDFVGEANDMQSLADLRSFLLPGLRRLVPSDAASYNEIAADGTALYAIADPDLPASAHEAWERHSNSNPILKRYLRTRDGRPYRFSDVVSQADLHRTDIYRELYRPLGIEHQIAFVVSSPPRLTIGIALSRGGREDFTDEERAVLDLVRPHLIQAYRNAHLRESLSQTLSAMRAGLDARGTAALFVDGDGVLVLSSERGAQLAEKAFPAELTIGETLPEPLAAILDGEDRTGSVFHPDGDAMLVHRVQSPDGMTVLFIERAAQVLTSDGLEGLGLTPREADVLARLAAGRSTSEVAAEIGISPRTVAKHTQRIHQKLGVRDRAQAIATAWAATAAAE